MSDENHNQGANPGLEGSTDQIATEIALKALGKVLLWLKLQFAIVVAVVSVSIGLVGWEYVQLFERIESSAESQVMSIVTAKVEEKILPFADDARHQAEQALYKATGAAESLHALASDLAEEVAALEERLEFAAGTETRLAALESRIDGLAVVAVRMPGRGDPTWGQEVRSFLEALSLDQVEGRAQACKALGELGAAGELGDATAEIEDALIERAQTDDDEQVRVAAVAALGRLANTERSVEALLEIMEKDTPWMADQTSLALAKLNARISGVLPKLQERLQHYDSSVRKRAATTIGFCGPAGAPAVADLVTLLKRQDESPAVRAQAAYALAKIGERAKVTIPDLRAFEHDQNLALRSAAQKALRRLEAD